MQIKFIKPMHKPEYEQIHNISESTQYLRTNLSLLISLIQYISLPILCTQLQGSTHIAADSIRPPRTQLWSLYLTINTHDPDVQIQRNQKPITHQIFFRKLPSTLRASLYLYIPMVNGPWVSWLTSYYSILFLGGQPFDSTYYISLSMHFAQSFTISLP